MAQFTLLNKNVLVSALDRYRLVWRKRYNCSTGFNVQHHLQEQRNESIGKSNQKFFKQSVVSSSYKWCSISIRFLELAIIEFCHHWHE